jgi:hypothetical protein
MTTEANRSSRMFEPGSGATFSDSTGATGPTDPASTHSATADDADDAGGASQAAATGNGRHEQFPGHPQPGEIDGDDGSPAGAGDNGAVADNSGSGGGDTQASAGGDDGSGSGAGDNAGGGSGPGDGGGGETGSDVIDTVVQTIGAGVGSSGQLNDILNPTDLFGGLTGGVGNGIGNALGTNGIVDTASGLVGTAVSDVSQPAGAIANSGSLDGVLNAVGNGAGNLVDDVLGAVDGASGNGIVGSILDGLGDNVVNGALGGTGLLSGTPLNGIQGDGALLGTGLLHADDSSSSNLIEVQGGTDTSHGLINVNAAGDRSQSESNHLVDTNIGQDSSGNGIVADLLGAERDSSGALVDADAGQHQGASLVTLNAGTTADQFQFPSLDGAGLDSLVGEIGALPDDPVGGGDLLPLSVGVDGHALIDIGADGTVDTGDTHIDDGTHIMVNTPLQGSLVA